MARNIVVRVTCDLCGESTDQDPVGLLLDGQRYDVDLCPGHVTEYRAALEPFVRVARKGATPPFTVKPRKRRKAPTSSKDDVAAIRAWARNQGLDVGTRGRISSSVIEAYESSVS